jgi:hypothetical protein
VRNELKTPICYRYMLHQADNCVTIGDPCLYRKGFFECALNSSGRQRFFSGRFSRPLHYNESMALDFQPARQVLLYRQSYTQPVRQSMADKMSHHDPSKQFPLLAPGPSSHIYAGQSSITVARTKKNSTACLQCKGAKRKVCCQPPCGAKLSKSRARRLA